MSIPHGGVRPEWVASNNFVMIHLDLVDALDGSWEAAGLLNRILYRAGKDGWWTATMEEIREDCRLTEHKARRAIQELRDAGMIESERASSFDPTQRWRVVFRDGGDIPPVTEVASFTVTEETSVTSSLKEGEELQTRTPVVPSGIPRDLVATRFDAFWHLYPRKQGKQAARKAWDKAVKTADPDAILQAVSLQRGALSQELARGFCPHPATWLNQGRWEDDVAVISNRGTNGTGSVYLQVAQELAAAEDGGMFEIGECR